MISKIDPDRINNVKIVGEYVGDKSLKDISNFCQLRNQYDFYDDISMCYNCGTIVKFDKVTKMLISCPKCKRTLFYNREGSDCNKNYMIFLNTTAITVERIKELYNKVNPCGGGVTQYFMDDMQYITNDVNNLLSFLQQSISKNPNTKKYVCLTAKEDCLIDILNSEIFRDKIQSTVYQRSDKSDCFIIAKVLN